MSLVMEFILLSFFVEVITGYLIWFCQYCIILNAYAGNCEVKSGLIVFKKFVPLVRSKIRSHRKIFWVVNGDFVSNVVGNLFLLSIEGSVWGH